MASKKTTAKKSVTKGANKTKDIAAAAKKAATSKKTTTTKKKDTSAAKKAVAKAQNDGKKKTTDTKKKAASTSKKAVAKAQNDGKKKTTATKKQQTKDAIKKGADTVADKAKTVSTIAKAQGQGQKQTNQVKAQQIADNVKKGADTATKAANAVKNVAKAQADGQKKTDQVKAQQANSTPNTNTSSTSSGTANKGSGGAKKSGGSNKSGSSGASDSSNVNPTTFTNNMPVTPQREESIFQKRALNGPDPTLVDNGGAVGNLYSGVGTDRTDLLARMVDGLRVNSLDNYISPQMRSDYIRDERQIRQALNDATNASYDVQRAKALQDAATAEDTNYANTKNAVAEMRRNLIGSGSSGANVGAANATALQALLGLGQQNTAATTEGLRNINNVERERSSALAQNAVDSINQANAATNDMYGAGTSAYGSDRSYGAQGAAQGIAEVRNGANTNLTNLIMNRETNTSQENVAGMNNTSQENVANINSAAQEAVARLNADATTQAAKLGQTSTQTIINKRR